MGKNNPPEVDLIPNFDAPTPEDVAPLHILRQQADLIESKTGFQVAATVKPARSSSSMVAYELELGVPNLGYRHKVLRIEFGLEVWPVVVESSFVETPTRANDKEQYVAALRKVFGSAAFRKVIGSMRALDGDDSVLGGVDEAVLHIFRLNMGDLNGDVPENVLRAEIAKLPGHLRVSADFSIESLVRKGLLEPKADGYTLTRKGWHVVQRAAV